LEADAKLREILGLDTENEVRKWRKWQKYSSVTWDYISSCEIWGYQSNEY